RLGPDADTGEVDGRITAQQALLLQRWREYDEALAAARRADAEAASAEALRAPLDMFDMDWEESGTPGERSAAIHELWEQIRIAVRTSVEALFPERQQTAAERQLE